MSLSDLLVFWTGADRVPPCGFDHPLEIQFYSQEAGDRRLPSSSTCALILWLPRNINDPDMLWGMLVDALTMSAGFGKI